MKSETFEAHYRPDFRFVRKQIYTNHGIIGGREIYTGTLINGIYISNHDYFWRKRQAQGFDLDVWEQIKEGLRKIEILKGHMDVVKYISGNKAKQYVYKVPPGEEPSQLLLISKEHWEFPPSEEAV